MYHNDRGETKGNSEEPSRRMRFSALSRAVTATATATVLSIKRPALCMQRRWLRHGHCHFATICQTGTLANRLLSRRRPHKASGDEREKMSTVRAPGRELFDILTNVAKLLP